LEGCRCGLPQTWQSAIICLVAKVRVLFLRTHNSARSQMAEGLLRAEAGGRFDVHSAGTKATALRPEAVRVMAQEVRDRLRHLIDGF